MDLHGDIMNIQALIPTEALEDGKVHAYKIGHKDARHAAAELALKADARIEELEEALKELYIASGTVANCAYNVGQSQEDWDNIKP